MSVTFCDIPKSREPGGLWFVIPVELQEHVVPWVKSKLHEVPTVAHRQHYRSQMTKASLKSGEGRDIWWKSHLGNTRSALYHRDGYWRVGCRGAAACLMRRIEDDFVAELRKFAEQRPEWVKIPDLSVPA
jgi:hypothetical protein